MEFEVAPFRRAGRVLPLWQRHRSWVRGRLFVDEVQDQDLRRMVRVARLLGGNATDDLLPPLYDVVLVACKPDRWTMTGYERTPTEFTRDFTHFQQSWILVPAAAADREKALSAIPKPSESNV